MPMRLHRRSSSSMPRSRMRTVSPTWRRASARSSTSARDSSSPSDRRADEPHAVPARPFGRAGHRSDLAAGGVDKQGGRHAEGLADELEVLKDLRARIGVIAEAGDADVPEPGARLVGIAGVDIDREDLAALPVGQAVRVPSLVVEDEIGHPEGSFGECERRHFAVDERRDAMGKLYRRAAGGIARIAPEGADPVYRGGGGDDRCSGEKQKDGRDFALAPAMLVKRDARRFGHGRNLGGVMSNKMWGGRFADSPDAVMEEINASIDFDRHLYRQDIAVSKAHAAMLAKQRIISADDAAEIIHGLDTILSEIEGGKFNFKRVLEDIHMNVESRLAELIGPAAGRLHTARSRNDQVATDFRLWIRGT